MPRLRLPDKDYFISRVTENSNGCWIWNNLKLLGNHGYIILGVIKGKSYLMHQGVYAVWTGKEPPRQGSG